MQMVAAEMKMLPAGAPYPLPKTLPLLKSQQTLFFLQQKEHPPNFKIPKNNYKSKIYRLAQRLGIKAQENRAALNLS